MSRRDYFSDYNGALRAAKLEVKMDQEWREREKYKKRIAATIERGQRKARYGEQNQAEANLAYDGAIYCATEQARAILLAVQSSKRGAKDVGWGNVGDAQHLVEELSQIVDRLYAQGEYEGTKQRPGVSDI